MEFPAASDDLTIEMLHQFYNIDRQVFARLVGEVGFDYETAMRVLGFWNWLESSGHSNVVYKTLSLSQFMLCSLAKEAIRCIKFLEKGLTPLPYYSDHFQLSLTPVFLGCKYFSLIGFLRESPEASEHALARIADFVENVGKKAFCDYVLFGLPKKVNYEIKLPSLLDDKNGIEAQFGSDLCSSNAVRSPIPTYAENPDSFSSCK